MHYASASDGSTAALLRSVESYAAEYLTAPRIGSSVKREELERAFGGGFPATGLPGQDVVGELVRKGEPGLLHSGSSTFLGFVMGGSYPVAVATEWLTSLWDQCGALYATSPVASVVEDTVARWLIELFGLPGHTSVGITSGCATANLSGLAAARHAMFQAYGWDVEKSGLIGAPRPRVLVSRGCHTTVYRALRLLGLAGHIVPVDIDDQGRMLVPALATAIGGSGSGPLIVCGQVGNVDSGSVEQLPEVCALTHAEGGWVHLDAAFGMWAAASPALKSRVVGLELADSWATDAHKWLNVPYDCGLVLCAHPDAHRAALRTTADYLTPAPEGARDPADYTPDLSRRARSLVLWATLRHLGQDGVAELVERTCRLARVLADRISRTEGIEVINDVMLNQVLVSLSSEHPRATLDAVVARLQAGGTGWASPTTWNGKPALRLSVCNWQTTDSDIEECASAIVGAYLSSRSDDRTKVLL